MSLSGDGPVSDVVRIGTWNLAGRWDARRQELLDEADCDILLLTEVSDRVDVPGMAGHTTNALMATRRPWAGVWSKHALTPLPDPHGATAMAEVLGVRICSSILPWRSCGRRAPWIGTTTYERTVEAVDAIVARSPTIWGGDWNHALRGREYGGSRAGRRHIVAALAGLGLTAPTAAAPHQIDGLLTIDHVAVPDAWPARVEHHSALLGEGRLSDHDAYVVEALPVPIC